MAVISSYFTLPSSSAYLFSSSPSLSSNHPRLLSCSSSSTSSPPPLMDPKKNGGERRSFMEFPYVSVPQRNLMVELVSMLETRLDSYLLPSNLPPDVQYYQNSTGSAHASLHVRSGREPSSPIDFILGSWIHSSLPSGGAFNITSLSAYLNAKTDAPNFLLELIQSGPTSTVLLLDLPPRRELVLNPDYIKFFYEDSKLDRHRLLLQNLPDVQPYLSSSLYIRSLFSPTAIAVRINSEKTERMDEIVRDHVSPIAKQLLETWLEKCACGERDVGETEKAYLTTRDLMTKRRTLEIDLGSSFPRLFGQEIADRVLGILKEYFNT